MNVAGLLKSLENEGMSHALSKVHFFYEENPTKEIRRECISPELSEVVNYEKTTENTVKVYVKKLTVGDDIRRWRTNAGLTREEMSNIFDIPVKTIESWEVLARVTAPWVYRMVIDRLREYAEVHYVKEASAQMEALESDARGERPVGVWAVCNGDEKNIYYTLFDALAEYSGKEEIFYMIANKGDTAFYQDKYGIPFIYLKKLELAESDRRYKSYERLVSYAKGIQQIHNKKVSDNDNMRIISLKSGVVVVPKDWIVLDNFSDPSECMYAGVVEVRQPLEGHIDANHFVFFSNYKYGIDYPEDMDEKVYAACVQKDPSFQKILDALKTKGKDEYGGIPGLFHIVEKGDPMRWTKDEPDFKPPYGAMIIRG